MRIGKILQLIKHLHGQNNMTPETHKIDGSNVECNKKTKSKDKNKRKPILKR